MKRNREQTRDPEISGEWDNSMMYNARIKQAISLYKLQMTISFYNKHAANQDKENLCGKDETLVDISGSDSYFDINSSGSDLED